MKKILMCVAVALAASLSHGASVKWTAGNIYGPDTVTKWAGEVALYAYAENGTADAAVKVATFTPATAGTVNQTFSNDALVGGTKYNFYFVIEDSGKTFTSPEKTGILMQATSTASVSFGNMATATQNASNWASSGGGGEPVPEPTSGLLLLLGMAGLALRRKRA